MIVFNHLPVEPLRVTSKFGLRKPKDANGNIIKGASTYHKGIDLGRDFSKPETEIMSVADGTVFNNYWNDYRGWVVIIDHGGFKTLYQHLKAKSGLKKGEKVKAGQYVGRMGNSSNKSKLSVATHLHFELIVNGKQIDPLPYLLNIKERKTMAETKKPHWAEKHLESLVKKGIINSPEVHKNTLDQPLTKAQVFALLDRITDK